MFRRCCPLQVKWQLVCHSFADHTAFAFESGALDIYEDSSASATLVLSTPDETPCPCMIVWFK